MDTLEDRGRWTKRFSVKKLAYREPRATTFLSEKNVAGPTVHPRRFPMERRDRRPNDHPLTCCALFVLEISNPTGCLTRAIVSFFPCELGE